MENQDKVTKGWQPWLTRRQTRMILEALMLYLPVPAEEDHHKKLVEWFDHEVRIHERKEA